MTPDSQPKPTRHELTRQAREHLKRAADKTERTFRELEKAVNAIVSLETALNQKPADGSGADEPLGVAHGDLDALDRVAAELARAREKFAAFGSAHEGYAVLLEEVRELEAVVFKKAGDRTRAQLQEEATQVAAMAIRFLVDIADKANPTTDGLLDSMGQLDRQLADEYESDVAKHAGRIVAWHGVSPEEARKRAIAGLARRAERDKAKAKRTADLEAAFWTLAAEWPGDISALRGWADELADQGEPDDRPGAEAIVRLIDGKGRVHAPKKDRERELTR